MYKQRIAYIDLVKGIGILCVLFGHLIPNDGIVKPAIYSFHMPLFFILTGILLKKESIQIKVSKKFHQVFIPYIVWGLIFSSFSFSKLALILYGTNESLIIAGSNGMLWFLVASFFASIIASLNLLKSFYRLANLNLKFGYIRESAIGQVSVTVGLFGISVCLSKIHEIINIREHIMGLPMSLDVSMLGATFVLYGTFLQKYILPKINRLENSKKLLLSMAFLIGEVTIAKENRGSLGYQQMATYNVGNPVIFTVMAILICTSLIIICETVMRLSIANTSIVRAIMWMGKNSMILFIIHGTLVYDLKSFCEIHGNKMIYIAAWLLLCVYSSVLTYIITKITPFLAGKNNKRLE